MKKPVAENRLNCRTLLHEIEYALETSFFCDKLKSNVMKTQSACFFNEL